MCVQKHLSPRVPICVPIGFFPRLLHCNCNSNWWSDNPISTGNVPWFPHAAPPKHNPRLWWCSQHSCPFGDAAPDSWSSLGLFEQTNRRTKADALTETEHVWRFLQLSDGQCFTLLKENTIQNKASLCICAANYVRKSIFQDVFLQRKASARLTKTFIHKNIFPWSFFFSVGSPFKSVKQSRSECLQM